MNAIEVNSLSKKYILGQSSHVNANLREIVESKIRGLFRGEVSKKINQNDFWALDDLSFKIAEGDRVGIIGRNGAGKSTLLKILSRITDPTSGQIKIRGKIASLLEVGTGFHPDLTGRENIFLNGSILGMSRFEIQKKFDEIVSFAEVEKFLDTPVKRYSSGMYVRLAFAVASCLESDILVVDEVLAVGDFQFQKKCFNKMDEVGKSGRTVLLVSHNMDSIRKFANKVLYLDKGKNKFFGETNHALDIYSENKISRKFKSCFNENADFERFGSREFAKLISIESNQVDGVPNDEVKFGEGIKFKINFYLEQKFQNPEIGICINTARGTRLHHIISSWNTDLGSLEKGSHSVELLLNEIYLYPGTYSVTCWIRCFQMGSSEDYIEDALNFEVKESVRTKDMDFRHCGPSGGVWIDSKWQLT